MELEIWRDVKDYEGFYQVSNRGRVKSMDRIEKSKSGWHRRRKGRLMNQRVKLNYIKVNLSKYGVKKTCFVHRLVADAFIINPKMKPHVDHINTIKTDNHVSNLRWVTPKENARNEITKTRYSRPHLGKVLSKSHLAIKVDQYSLNMDFIKTWGSAKEAAMSVDCSTSNITDCIKGRIKKTHNYIFKYHESR